VALGYAVTVHKAQGSEYPVVVVPLVREHGRNMLQRPLLYTAMSRAKELLVLVASQELLVQASRTTDPLERLTNLPARVRESLALSLSDSSDGGSTTTTAAAAAAATAVTVASSSTGSTSSGGEKGGLDWAALSVATEEFASKAQSRSLPSAPAAAAASGDAAASEADLGGAVSGLRGLPTSAATVPEPPNLVIDIDDDLPF